MVTKNLKFQPNHQPLKFLKHTYSCIPNSTQVMAKLLKKFAWMLRGGGILLKGQCGGPLSSLQEVNRMWSESQRDVVGIAINHKDVPRKSKRCNQKVNKMWAESRHLKYKSRHPKYKSKHQIHQSRNPKYKTRHPNASYSRHPKYKPRHPKYM